MTGIHLLATGELEADLTRLMARLRPRRCGALARAETCRRAVGLDPALLEAWRPRIDALFAQLDAARETSPLPEEPANEGEMRDWLLAVRRSRFG